MNKTFLIAFIAAMALAGVESAGAIPAVESLQSKISSIKGTTTYRPSVASSLVSSASKAASSIASVVSEHQKTVTATVAAQTSIIDSNDTANQNHSGANTLMDNYGLLAQLTIITTIVIASFFAVLA